MTGSLCTTSIVHHLKKMENQFTTPEEIDSVMNAAKTSWKNKLAAKGKPAISE